MDDGMQSIELNFQKAINDFVSIRGEYPIKIKVNTRTLNELIAAYNGVNFAPYGTIKTFMGVMIQLDDDLEYGVIHLIADDYNFCIGGFQQKTIIYKEYKVCDDRLKL